MTRQSMVEATERIAAAPIYGIVSLENDGELLEYEVSWDDAEGDFRWALDIVRRAGIGPGDHILCATPNHELPWTGPFIRAFREVGAIFIPVEQHGWDAPRFTSVLNRLPITVIFGLWPETVAAVAAQNPDLREFFAKPRIIWARPDAVGELEQAGVECLPFVVLGPALGLGLPGGDGVYVDGDQWTLGSEHGQIMVSSGPTRSAELRDVATGFTGKVEKADSDWVIRPGSRPNT
ncbi:hypothetical protein ABZ413_30525 [Nocardia rhamnosiphila]|uniref:hypothetical protein n=1 Tax=Nocardia rhamnosiphila TaxID=426716 RepID=UPI0033D86EED